MRIVCSSLPSSVFSARALRIPASSSPPFSVKEVTCTARIWDTGG